MWLKKVSKKDIGATSCFNLELKSIAGELGFGIAFSWAIKLSPAYGLLPGIEVLAG